ncbi:nitronate monooxygenase [Pseudomonas chlororaphis]|uniref:NAD(P)H-dependent flavin oxidoreductase n=1 Tax=Pseudomonas chlororaphis TaxID=587753 RepID=UPI00087BE6F9|nr:nitronate monooxygenase [Pseudomonas chlororaphis]AZD67369.1 Enoyl-ACP reductase (FMN) [Pseudomonas chlororaphis subsp. aurantiaca]AZD73838.1 Enoyl-ACP reductase (FMN) [Pseudomonas chlororaphis subsp. aurantiaca]QIT23356.1 nitronate monooxygenase [Pseudomonas chlororaphis subsp. aurantiaca]WDH01442.1 nitronate monooxygenase [Pseudomonas chlororaphis]WDH09711.1 nitronate monooxygenase [Pseudomonas chlororaphis]
MSQWPDTRILDLLGIELPIIQAPMAGATTTAMVIAAAQAGALGSLPCAMLSPEQIRQDVQSIRQATSAPLNLNFFCHQNPTPDPEREIRWKNALEPYYRELGADFEAPTPVSSRAPFDAISCELVEELRPEIVSFHFGLPEPALLARVKAIGAKILSSASTVDEAVWLEQHGCDAIIAMGYEAGGHRAIFLSEDLNTQVGTMALVPQIADAVRVPVIAAGGIGDARGIVAAFALGASAVQLGTAYLFTPEAKVSAAHHRALRTAKESETALTNLFTGRPARGIVNRVMREIGPISPLAPAFPLAGGALMPLRAKDEADFANLWAGQALRLGLELPAYELTRTLAEQALAKLNRS